MQPWHHRLTCHFLPRCFISSSLKVLVKFTRGYQWRQVAFEMQTMSSREFECTQHEICTFTLGFIKFSIWCVFVFYFYCSFLILSLSIKSVYVCVLHFSLCTSQCSLTYRAKNDGRRRVRIHSNVLDLPILVLGPARELSALELGDVIDCY